ncbi:MAG TPA: cyclodeaminase/cyclohydrolase family protein [Nocardioidaceae bacterium]|nr:cyclodeaminase/cyclohydrolase family protein [Nocardioidaceae bacterium]
MAGWEGGDYLDRPLRDLLSDIAGAEPVPAAGSTVAGTTALAAALTAKVARRSRRADAAELAARADLLRTRVEAGVAADAAAYADVLSTPRDERDPEAAAHWPRTVRETASELAGLARDLADNGNPNLRYDAEAAARLATVSSEIAESLLRANASLTPP